LKESFKNNNYIILIMNIRIQRSYIKFILLAFLMQISYNLSSQNTNFNVITTAVPFIRIAPDARASGMADVGVSTSPDANSGFHNPAKFAFIDNDEGGSLNFAPWLRQITNDIYLGTINSYMKIAPNHTFGIGFRYFTLGSIQLTDANGAQIGQGKPNEFTLEGHYAFRLAESFGIGTSARYIYSNLSSGLPSGDAGPGSAFAVDFAMYYRKKLEMIPNVNSAHLNIGLNMSNIGSKMQYSTIGSPDFIPANIGLGTTFEAEIDDANKISVSLEFNKLMVPSLIFLKKKDGTDSILDPEYKKQSSLAGALGSFSDHPEGISGDIKEVIIQAGAEYSYQKTFFLRAGYFFESEQAGGRNFASAGAGFKYNKLMIDFAYLIPLKQQRSPLDNQIKISLTLNLGEENSKYASNW
jgi:hypothetical protein